MRGDPRNPGDWLKTAKTDLDRAKKRLADDDLEDAIFHLEQVAEKAMKGGLISLGWNLARTHNLPELLDELQDRKVDASFFEPVAELLTNEYLAGRYPGAADPPCARTIDDNT